MTIFNHAHFLRHISLPTLRQFTDAHPLGPELAIDWGQPEDTLPRLLNDAVAIRQDSLSNAELLEVIGWMQWLELEQRHLVWMRAERYRWEDISKRFGCCTRTAQRRWNGALQVIEINLFAR